MDIVLVFLVGAFAAFYGAMVGGGGLITIPFLIFLGLPPQMAIATNKVGSLGLLTGAFLKYFKSGKIQWKVVVPFSVVGVLAGVVGANFMLSIDQDLLQKIIAIVILFILVLIVWKRKVGLEHKETSKTKVVFGYICYFFSMVWGAFFGGGFGILVSYTLVYLFGFTMIESAATSKIPSFFMGVTAVIVYVVNGVIHLPYALAIVVGMFLGGYVGASFAVKRGNKTVKFIFVVVVVVSSIKLLFF